jgi:hypothetical protein
MCISETAGNLLESCQHTGIEATPATQSIAVGRRAFLGGLATIGIASSIASQTQGFDEPAATNAAPAQPAEALIKELYASLSEEQRSHNVYAYNHKADGKLTRHGMYNAPYGGKKIGEQYSKTQQELIDRILKAMTRDEEGYIKITRGGRFDDSDNLQGCGASFFGNATDKNKYCFMFTSHHLTIRCDGNSAPGAAFAGPLYYGHSANGYSTGNVYHYQTQQVHEFYDALDAKQRKLGLTKGSPGEQAQSIKFRANTAGIPGIGVDQLSSDQKELMQAVMQSVLSPYRQEDADEVMEIIKHNGGMDKLRLAFYKDSDTTDSLRWHFWRIEGPGLVWNYRALPHVHTFVNIAKV